METLVVYVRMCKCGNEFCDEEALPERCQCTPHQPRPETVNDRAERLTLDWED